MNRFALQKTLFFAPLFAAILVACPTDKITGIDATATPASLSSGGISGLTASVSGTGTFNTWGWQPFKQHGRQRNLLRAHRQRSDQC
jgi:hypothetical protein